jgi:hypothetical protein
LFPALVIAVSVCLLHYSIVWAATERVDVVADNGAPLSLFLPTGELRRFTVL